MAEVDKQLDLWGASTSKPERQFQIARGRQNGEGSEDERQAGLPPMPSDQHHGLSESNSLVAADGLSAEIGKDAGVVAFLLRDLRCARAGWLADMDPASSASSSKSGSTLVQRYVMSLPDAIEQKLMQRRGQKALPVASTLPAPAGAHTEASKEAVPAQGDDKEQTSPVEERLGATHALYRPVAEVLSRVVLILIYGFPFCLQLLSVAASWRTDGALRH